MMKRSWIAAVFALLAGASAYAFYDRYLSPKRQLHYLLRRHLL